MVRPPKVNMTFDSEGSAVAEVKGIQLVRDGNFLGLAAPDQPNAIRVAKTTTMRWKTSSEPQPDNATLFDYFRKNAREGRGRPVGSVADGFAAADKTHEQTYTVAYIAHAPLEPRAAIAEFVDNKLTVWTGTQLANGTILNPRFKNYRLPRFSDVPPIEVVLVNRKDLPSAGAGETPIVGLAPAVSNAIFAATGKRLRSLPLAPNGL